MYLEIFWAKTYVQKPTTHSHSDILEFRNWMIVFVDYILSFFIFDNGYWSYFGRLALVVEMGMGGGFLLLWRLGVVVMMILSPTKEPRLLLPTVRHVRISICGFQKNWDTVFRREGIRRKHLKNWLSFWGGRLIWISSANFS